MCFVEGNQLPERSGSHRLRCRCKIGVQAVFEFVLQQRERTRLVVFGRRLKCIDINKRGTLRLHHRQRSGKVFLDILVGSLGEPHHADPHPIERIW